MAKLKLTELPSAASRAGADLLYLVQGGVSKQIATDVFLANLYTGGSGIVVESNGMIVANVQLPAIDLTSNTTDELPEGNANLYFTNTRAIGALTAGDGIAIEANGMVISEFLIDRYSTDDLREGNTFLYFTNTRVVDAITAGPGIIISANGMISIDTSNVFLMDFGGLGSNVDGVIDYGGL
jgi:hypothetical protein